MKRGFFIALFVASCLITGVQLDAQTTPAQNAPPNNPQKRW